MGRTKYDRTFQRGDDEHAVSSLEADVTYVYKHTCVQTYTCMRASHMQWPLHK